MELTIPLAALKHAVDLAKHVTGSTKTTVPIASHLLVTVTKNHHAIITGTNLGQALTLRVPAEVKAPGVCTVPAKLFGDLLGTLGDKAITLTADGTRVQYRSGANRGTLSGHDPEDFPPLPKHDPQAAVSVDGTALRDALARVLPCAAQDETRPILAGVRVALDDDGLTLAAADGFRLALDRVPVLPREAPAVPDDGDGAASSQPAIPPAREWVVPLAACQQLVAILRAPDAPVSLSFGAGHLSVACDLVSFLTTLQQGTYPNVTQLLPTRYQSRLTLDTGAFRDAVAPVALIAKDSNQIVRLEVEPPGTLYCWAQSETGDAIGSAGVTLTGEAAKVALNTLYLSTVLRLLSGSVQVDMQAPNSPVVFRAAALPDYLHVVMPMASRDEPRPQYQPTLVSA